MTIIGRVGRQLRSLFFKATPRQEVDAELEFHVAMREHELAGRGLPPDEAHRVATSRLGDAELLKRRLAAIGESRDRDTRRAEWLDELRQDLRFTMRQLAAAPAFAALAVGTLAVGIGGTTAIFSAVRAVALRPFPWAHPERTMLVVERWREQNGNASVGNYTDWAAQSTSFTHLAAEVFAGFTLGDGPSPERVTGGRVTSNYFPVFGQGALIGRTFTADEDAPGHAGVVVLGEGLWRRRFGADSAILGTAIRVNTQPFTVIGVMPASFDPLLSSEQLWVPAAFTPVQQAMHDEHYINVIGLLKPGVEVAAANADLQRVGAEVARKFPNDAAGRAVLALPLGPFLIGNARQRLFFVLGAVALVLLIACGNVANLQLARGAARARELAIRAAIGAGRARLARQLLTEGLLLSLLAATLGVALAAGLIRILVAAAPPDAIPRLGETHIDLTVLAFALGAALFATIVSGLVPALRLARQDPQDALRGQGRGSSAGPGRERLRGALVTLEVTLALVLLVGSGLLVRTAIEMQHVSTGFDADQLTSGRVALPSATFAGPERVRGAYEQLQRVLAASPGITAAALVSTAPFSGTGGSNGLLPEGKAIDQANVINSSLRLVTPEYFATMRIPIRRGRAFSATDIRGNDRVMIISEELARRAWPGEDPIGKRVRCCEGSAADPMMKTVIGIAGDVRSRGAGAPIDAEFYLPIAQTPDAAWGWIGNTMSMVVRAAPSVDAAAAMRAAVREIDPALPVFRISTAADAFNATLAPARFNALLLGTLALMGLVLSAAGIFGVIAYFVTLRTREIGVRRALGATTRDVLLLTTWQGLKPVAIGLALGSAVAFLGSRLLSGALYGVGPNDPITFAAVAVLLGGVAVVAVIVPALRAVRIEPTQALAGD